MTIARIYLPREMEAGERVTLAGPDRRYILAVRRMKKGDKLLLFDGKGNEYEAVILDHDPESLSLEIARKESRHTAALRITLAQSLPKAKKMDFIIEKASELGAAGIIPFLSLRSVPQLTPGQGALKQRRWQKIALEAARKSHAGSIPEVSAVLTFEEMLGSADDRAVKLIFWEEEKKRHLKQMFKERIGEERRDFFLVVGPEGGLAREEVDLAVGRGFTSVSLGRQVLKVEMAALALLAIIQYERGLFGADGLSGGDL